MLKDKDIMVVSHYLKQMEKVIDKHLDIAGVLNRKEVTCHLPLSDYCHLSFLNYSAAKVYLGTELADKIKDKEFITMVYRTPKNDIKVTFYPLPDAPDMDGDGFDY